MAATMCYRFTLGERAWEIDFATLRVNDWILLQEVSGRTKAGLLAGLEDGDAVSFKVLLWTARRASGEDVTLDSDEMNPVWGEDAVQRIPHLTPAETAPPAPKRAAPKAASKK